MRSAPAKPSHSLFHGGERGPIDSPRPGPALSPSSSQLVLQPVRTAGSSACPGRLSGLGPPSLYQRGTPHLSGVSKHQRTHTANTGSASRQHDPSAPGAPSSPSTPPGWALGDCAGGRTQRLLSPLGAAWGSSRTQPGAPWGLGTPDGGRGGGTQEPVQPGTPTLTNTWDFADPEALTGCRGNEPRQATAAPAGGRPGRGGGFGSTRWSPHGRFCRPGPGAAPAGDIPREHHGERTGSAPAVLCFAFPPCAGTLRTRNGLTLSKHPHNRHQTIYRHIYLSSSYQLGLWLPFTGRSKSRRK